MSNQDEAWRLVRRADEEPNPAEREALLRRAARLVGREEQRRMWRKLGREES